MKTIDEMLSSVAESMNIGNDFDKNQKKSKSEEIIVSNEIISKPNILSETKTYSIKHERLSLSLAKELAKAVEIASDIIGIKTVVAVVNEGANLILLHAMDDAYIASVDIAKDKAYTSAALKMSTHEALELSRGGALDGLTNTNGIMLLGGGEPLLVNGKLYGAIGVSGGTKDQDITLSKTAAEIFKILIK